MKHVSKNYIFMTVNNFLFLSLSLVLFHSFSYVKFKHFGIAPQNVILHIRKLDHTFWRTEYNLFPTLGPRNEYLIFLS